MRRVVALLLVAMPVGFAVGQSSEDKAKQELLPKPVAIQGEDLSVADALAQLAKQSGNTVVDRRRSQNGKKIKLDLTRTTFWPAVEEIARSSGCGFSVYDGDAPGVSLIDRPLRSTAVDQRSLLRVAPRSVSVTRDEESGVSQCLVDLEVAWEPRCQPLYLGVGPMTATFAADKQGKQSQSKLEARGRAPVLGKAAGDVKVLLPAPDRSVAALASLEGTLAIVAPSKMLRFAFTGLKEGEPLSQTQEEIKVSLTRVKAAADRWTFDVLIDNPKDGPVFESFQTYDWLYYNRIALEHKDSKTVWLSEPADNEDVTPATSHRAHISYHFTKKGGNVPAKDDVANWRLVYVTPGRIVELQVPFTLKNIALP
jgi:hypothetical protein